MVGGPLDLKLLRDLLAMKGQMAAIALVMASGLIVMIMERGLVVSLEASKERYYEAHRLADVFVDLKRAPNAIAKELEKIPDTAAVETRVRGSAILDIPGMSEPAEGSIISLPEGRPQKLNLLYLAMGRLPMPGNRGEVVVSEAFANAHSYRPGDTIEAIIHGGKETLRIVGIALSPEFVYELPTGGFMPDSRRYGVFWMGERELSKALGVDGAFNSALVKVAPGGNIEAVKEALDALLAPYGALASFSSKELLSVKVVDEEIRGLRAIAIAFPLVFLAIAAFMTSAALTRLVRLQKEQIAQLKAFGYSSYAIGVHYAKFSLAVAIASAAIAVTFGNLAGKKLLTMYDPFFHFPSLEYHTDLRALALSLLASAIASLFGVINAVKGAVSLPPAEAMRPEPPAKFKPSLLERLGFGNFGSISTRMAMRNLERKPWQALFTAIGLIVAVAIPVISVSMKESLDSMMELQWGAASRQDVTINLVEPTSHKALYELRKLPGVIYGEPFRILSATISHGHKKERVGITGLQREPLLKRILDAGGKAIALPASGLYLSKHLADKLGAKPGDPLRVEILEEKRITFDTTLAGSAVDFAGVGAYMEIGQLQRLMLEGGTIDGASVTIDDNLYKSFLKEVKRSPRIASILATKDARVSYQKMMGEIMDITQSIIFFFSIVVTCGVIYNSARISLSERTRDLSTLLVLGFTHKEVTAILVTELTLLTLLSIAPGFFLGKELAGFIFNSLATEVLRLPTVVTKKAYATSSLIVLLSSLFSFIAVSMRMKRLDLLDVLKAGE